ncbi:MAG: hypothetical protein IK031_03735 [Bacteroidales bacterium]|nr:hypothetical protein [Bacteroidales bacterium]
MKRLGLILMLTLCCAFAGAQVLPDCAKPDSSVLRIPGSGERMARFAGRLQAVRQSPDSSATIWHIGGSHVQAGWFSSRIRHNFDSLGLYPAGSRGYVFPYPLAHTNFDRSYTVRGEGEWTGTRSSNPNRNVPVSPGYGIMGIAAYTADSLAAFSFGMPEPFVGLHILGQASDSLLVPMVIAGADSLLCERDTLLRGFYAAFDEPVDSVRIELHLTEGQHFTVTGLLPETLYGGGVKVVSTGVNGARTTTWTDRCPEFDRELALVHPDLVLLGLGINDSTCPAKDFRPEKFKNNYRKLIDRILQQSPDCALVFITNNDSWRYVRRRMVHNDNGAAVHDAMFELAAEYDGAVWDLFTIMGGNGSATAWRDAGLMKNDRLHFTREGYELLGDMLYKAITDQCAE